jgi:ParB family chromosome partitioning protein
MTTMTPTTGVQASEQTTVVWLDPQTLAAAAGNIRADIGEIGELVASIKAYGVLEPLVVIPDGDGYRLIAGKRRAAAAVEAGASLVPCWERADLAGATSEVAAQLIENEHRKMLNVAERARGYHQLAMAGMSANKIAKATGTRAAAVRQALKVGGSDIATAVAERYELSLDQALVLAEFDSDPELIKVLVAVAKKSPGQWDHTVSRLRADRAEAKARQDLIEGLTAAGVRIIEDGAMSRTLRVSNLADGDGKALDVDEHASCPGHAVMIVSDWSGVRTVPYCIEPDTHGHTDRFLIGTSGPSTTTKGGDGKLTEAAKAERRLVIDNNRAWRAAEPVRREYIKTLLSRKTPPKGTLRYVAGEVLGRPSRLNDGTEGLLADLLGVNDPGGYGRHVGAAALADVNDARLPLMLLAQVAAAYEQTMDVHIWRSKHPDAADWLEFLASTGYTLSPVERLAIDTATGRAAANGGADSPGGDDDGGLGGDDHGLEDGSDAA